MKQETIPISKKEICLDDVFDFPRACTSNEPTESKEPIYDLDTIFKLGLEQLKLLKPSQRKKVFDFAMEIADKIWLDIYFSSILAYIEERVNITSDAKRIIFNDLKLLESTKKVILNLEPFRNINFTFKKIDFDYDPDEPEWETITISIKIKERDYEKLFEMEDEIVIKAFEGIDIEMIKKITITNIF